MTDKVREEFEAWDRATFASEEQEQNKYENGEYEDAVIQQCWMAWKASRESMVIELPHLSEKGEPDIFGNPGEWVNTAAGYKDSVERVLKQAGLKVK